MSAVSPFAIPPVLASDTLLACFSGTLELKASKESAHNWSINSVAFSPDGKTIVSGSNDQTIKVWDAGARFVSRFTFCHAGSLHRSHTFPCLSQVLWSSRQPERAPTTTRSAPSPSLPMVLRSSPDRLTRRSKCGTQVIAFPTAMPLPKLMPSALCRHPGAESKKRQCTWR